MASLLAGLLLVTLVLKVVVERRARRPEREVPVAQDADLSGMLAG